MRETLYQDEDIRVSCDYLFNQTKVAMHLNITPGSWSPSKFKKNQNILVTKIVPFLKARNYNEVYATPYENDTKAQKLIKMFEFQTYGQNAGHVLMKREI